MTRVLGVIFTFVLGLLIASGGAAQSIGASVGANFDRLSDIRFNDREATFSSSTGWHAELWIEFPFGPMGLRAGARYMDAGMLFAGLSEHTSTVRDNFDVTLLEVPLLLRYAVGVSAVQPTVFAGPVARFKALVDHELADDIRSPSLAGEAGVGLEISLGGLRLLPEIAYTWGITDFIDKELVIGSVTLSANESQKMNSAMVRVAIAF